MRALTRRALCLPLVVTLAMAVFDCKPDLGERESLVTRTRILAVQSEPPEAHPGDAVKLALLVASPNAAATGEGAAWSYCTEPVLLTENTSVSATCTASPDARQAIDASGPSVGANVPASACAVYGPEVPPGSDLRPHDPDTTGGYYQPVRAALPDEVAFGFTRLGCKLAGASADVATEFQARYVANHNPRLRPLLADIEGRAIDLKHVARGARLHLVASWGDGADGAEPYVVFDVASQTVVARRESMRVSWFATDGVFDEDRTGRAEDDLGATAENVWTAPSRPGPVHAWLVLRDSRGGVDFAAYDLDVE